MTFVIMVLISGGKFSSHPCSYLHMVQIPPKEISISTSEILIAACRDHPWLYKTKVLHNVKAFRYLYRKVRTLYSQLPETPVILENSCEFNWWLLQLNFCMLQREQWWGNNKNASSSCTALFWHELSGVYKKQCQFKHSKFLTLECFSREHLPFLKSFIK